MWIRRDFPDQGGDGATNQNKARTRRRDQETTPLRPSTPRCTRCGYCHQKGYVATEISRLIWSVCTLDTKIGIFRLSRPKNPAAVFATQLETARPNAAISIFLQPRWRKHDFCDQGGDDVIFATKVETVS